MPQRESGSPRLLGVLILMIIIGMILFVFFAFIRSGGIDFEGPVTINKPGTKDPKDKHATEEAANSVDQANHTPGRTLQPVGADPAKAEAIKKLLAETNPKKPFSTLPPSLQPPKAEDPDDPAHALKAIPVSGNEAAQAEPVHEVKADSAEGSALLKDATARIDEAPNDMYPDKAKAKVREGLKSARRIFKIYTVYFEKGGAAPTPKDKDGLNKALQEQALVDSMGDPRTIFFVLGFADKSGDASTNKKLSSSRADVVVNMLKNDCGLLNLTYPVAVGSTELVSPGNQNKNRAAEVWMVLP